MDLSELNSLERQTDNLINPRRLQTLAEAVSSFLLEPRVSRLTVI